MTDSSAQQEPARRDPFELWRQFYEANEQAWSKAVREMVTTREYAEAQGKMLETFLAFQKMMREGMTTQLTNLNLPTRDDVARLGELILGLEEKVDQLEDRLASLDERLAKQGRAEAAPRRNSRAAGSARSASGNGGVAPAKKAG